MTLIRSPACCRLPDRAKSALICSPAVLIAAASLPQPKVESAVLRLALKDPARATALRESGLPAFLHDAFLHRRKMLRRMVGEDALGKAGIAASARPEQVEPEAWVRLLTARGV